MRHNSKFQLLTFFFFCAVLNLSGLGSQVVLAQSTTSDVIIDMGVLETLPQASSGSPHSHIQAKPSRLTDFTQPVPPADETNPVTLYSKPSPAATILAEDKKSAVEENEPGIRLPPSSLAPVKAQKPTEAQIVEPALPYIAIPASSGEDTKTQAIETQITQPSPLLPVPGPEGITLSEVEKTLSEIEKPTATKTTKAAPLPLRKPELQDISTHPGRLAEMQAPLPPRQPGQKIQMITSTSEALQASSTEDTIPAMPAVPAEKVKEEILANNSKEKTGHNKTALNWADLSNTAPMETILALAQIAPASGAALAPPPYPTRKPQLISAPAHTSGDITSGNSSLSRALPFAPGSVEISPQTGLKLEGPILSELLQNPYLRLQIKAFASMEAGQTPGDARRLSLARALAVRAWLMEKGIEARRMDIRALGAQSPENSGYKDLKPSPAGYDGILLSFMDPDRI